MISCSKPSIITLGYNRPNDQNRTQILDSAQDVQFEEVYLNQLNQYQLLFLADNRLIMEINYLVQVR